jgi:hypothetical protein
MIRSFFIVFIFIINIYADSSAYINITSNATNTTIYLDGKLIGTTPIKQYEVIPNKTIKLKATVDKNYFLKDIEATIKVKQNTIPTIKLTFKKAKAKIFLIGENAELYLNGKFIKQLKSHNRVITVDAQKDLKIKLKNGYKEIEIVKNIVSKSFIKIKYKLKNIPLDIRLYTISIGNLMWEDTKEAKNSPVTWEKADEYCKSLRLGRYENWRIPTIEQLELLYENNKDNLYNGYGGEFYWSSNRFQDRTKIWKYAKVISFKNGKIDKSIVEFEQGRIRCVREIADKNIKIKNKK